VNKQDWSRTTDVIENISGRATRLYLGRTWFPERRLLEHRRDKGLNKLFTLFWSDDLDEVARAERSILKKFGELANLENSVADSRGGWRAGSNGVYVAWTWSGGGGNRKVGGMTPVLVNDLPAAPGRSRYLQTSLSIADADSLLSR
jgi:hypothetical protein